MQTYKSHTKKNKKRPSKRILTITVIAVLVLCILGGLFIWQKQTSDNKDKEQEKTSDIRPQNTVDYSPANKGDNADVENAKNNPKKESTTIDNQTTNPSGTVDFSVTVTGANSDNSAQLVRVSTLVNGTVSGTCTVTFTQAGQANVTASNQVELQNNSYVCPNFTIPYSQFPTGGQWTVSVAVTSNGKTVTGQWQGGPITINK